MALSFQQKKELAKDYFTMSNLSQKEIAQKVGVTEKTLSKWANENNEEWKQLRDAVGEGMEQEIIRLKRQLKEFNDYIEKKDKGLRFGSSKEYDALMKLRRFIDYFERNPLSSVVSIMLEFLEFYKMIDLDKAKDLSSVSDAFIKSKMKK
jgi:transcriptional regulator with XRE-family HTH domain